MAATRFRFHVGDHARQSNQQNPGMQQALAKHHLAEILVGGQEQSITLETSVEYIPIVDTRFVFGDKNDIVPIGTESVDNFLLDVLVRYQSHA